MTADLLIEATTVIDGTETPDYTADVPVTDGRITGFSTHCGPLSGARRHLDARGSCCR